MSLQKSFPACIRLFRAATSVLLVFVHKNLLSGIAYTIYMGCLVIAVQFTVLARQSKVQAYRKKKTNNHMLHIKNLVYTDSRGHTSTNGKYPPMGRLQPFVHMFRSPYVVHFTHWQSFNCSFPSLFGHQSTVCEERLLNLHRWSDLQYCAIH